MEKQSDIRFRSFTAHIKCRGGTATADLNQGVGKRKVYFTSLYVIIWDCVFLQVELREPQNKIYALS